MDLLRRVREDFGLPLIGVRPTGLGADALAVLFRGETTDGTGYAVKSSTAAQPGLLVADFLARRGVRGIPAPLRTRSGALTADHDGAAVSVVPWVDGRRAIETGLDAAQWRGFGTLLGAVHSTVPAPPLVGGSAALPAALPVDRHDPRAEVSRARSFPERLADSVAQAPWDPLLAELAAVWEAGGQRVLEVAALAESTASSAAWEGADPVICHADPHHGNLLLGSLAATAHGVAAGAATDGAGVWLVDWDDALLAPREADLIFVVGGVYSFAPITATEVDWFFEGYTPSSGGVTLADLDRTRLTHYRSTRALTDFLDFAEAVFADDVLDVRQDPAARAAALRIAAGALSPEGLVSIALSEAGAGH